MTQVSHKSQADGEMQTFQDEFRMDDLKEMVELSGCMQNTKRQWTLMVAKLKRQRLVALAALSRSRVMLANMQLFIAENELKNINVMRKVKLNQNNGKSNGVTSTWRNQQHSPYRRSATPTTSASSSLRSNVLSKSSTTSKSICSSTFKYIPNNRQSVQSPKLSTSSVKTDLTSDVKETSTPSQSPISVASLNTLTKSNASANSSDSNKHLTDSIIAEFNKPYQKIEKPVNYSTSNDSSVNNLTSTPKHMPYINNVSKKQSQDIKIKPVSNIDAYKTSYTHDSLSYMSRDLYEPSTSTVKPSVHPKDPRAYYSKLISKEKPITPMKLAVSPMMRNKDVPATKQNEPKKLTQKEVPTSPDIAQSNHNCSPPAAKQAEGRGIFISNTIKHHDYSLVSTSTPIKQRHVPLVTPEQHSKCRHNMPAPIIHSKKHNDDNKGERKHITPPKKPENRNVLVPTISNVEHRHMSLSTPQKWYKNKHICVPVPPMYKHSPSQYVCNANIKEDVRHSLNYLPMFDSNSKMKENCTPNTPKKVCFYHSS